MSKPNIIFIMADDMGCECLGVNGSTSYETPNLDRLAANGVNFQHCYSTPLCTPSRVEVMTGRYSFRNYEGFCFLNPVETSFGNILKDAGYTTAIVGKWQLGGGGARIEGFGFDEHCVNNMGVDHEAANTIARERYANPLMYRNGEFLSDEEIDGRYGPDICCDYALDFIERNKEEPFFLYYPMLLVHSPFWPTPDSPEWADPDMRRKHDKRFYKDMVEYADKLVGKLISKLEELGLADNTLVMFTGDNGTPSGIINEVHGESVEGGKGYMPDAGTHVPFVASFGGKSPDGLVTDDLIDFTDVFPTLAEAGGAALPENVIIDGRSFLPQICGEKGSPRDWAFCHYDPMVPFSDWQSHSGRWARTQQYKLYNDGRFYDVPADRLEENPLDDEQIGEEGENCSDALQSVHGTMPPFEERGFKLRDFNQEQGRAFTMDFLKRR